MFAKFLIAAAAVATVAASASAPANAKVNVDLYLGGFGPGYYEPAYPVYDGGRGIDDGNYAEPRRRHGGYGISCEQGRDEVRYSGFRKVRALDCSGRRYTYKARKNGQPVIVKVSRRSGDIISVERAW